MTQAVLDIPAALVGPLRCTGTRASGRPCGRWLHDSESVARKMGPDCAERAGLVPPPAPRLPTPSSDVTPASLLDLIHQQGEPMQDQPGRFRRTSVDVDAVQWTGHNLDACTAVAGNDFHILDEEYRYDDPEADGELLETRNSRWVLLRHGDWIVRRGDQLAKVSAEEFAATFEAVP
jgi:hypothetical protein